MTYKEKRDHKFKILFMYGNGNDDLDSTMTSYFENYPYEEDGDNSYIDGDKRAHKNVSKVVLDSEDKIENESDKAVVLSLSDEDNIVDIKNKVTDIVSKIDTIDKIIKDNLVTWDISRVGKAELIIIRLAIYEMYFDKQIEVSVAINEAVELAKVYGDDKASKFVNGVLSTIYKSKKE